VQAETVPAVAAAGNKRDVDGEDGEDGGGDNGGNGGGDNGEDDKGDGGGDSEDDGGGNVEEGEDEEEADEMDVDTTLKD
jgi:hypothetical protein